MRIAGQESRTISEQAAEWLCALAEGGPEKEAAFVAWLRKSPRHIEEFLMATTAWQGLRQMSGGLAMSVEAVLAELREASSDANVVQLPGSGNAGAAENAAAARDAEDSRSGELPYEGSQTIEKSGTVSRWKGARWLAAAAALVATVVLGWWAVYSTSVYRTAVGEQRTVRLSDGSVLYLNTASRARLRYSDEAREVELLAGEALFVVARDSKRPFRVAAGPTVIQAVGTQFNVRRGENDTRVSVIEGRVKLEAPSDARHRIDSIDAGTASGEAAGADARQGSEDTNLLDAGEEATVQVNGRVVRQTSGDVAQTVAWRERRVVFRAERLEDVIAEINRYGTRHFRIEGPKARSTRLTATFDVDSPESLAAFLQRYSALTVKSEGDDYVIRDRGEIR